MGEKGRRGRKKRRKSMKTPSLWAEGVKGEVRRWRAQIETRLGGCVSSWVHQNKRLLPVFTTNKPQVKNPKLGEVEELNHSQQR